MLSHDIFPMEADRKADVLRAVKAAATAAELTTALASGLSGAAFDGCQDFSKHNAGRHNASRADTFKNAESLGKALEPFGGSAEQLQTGWAHTGAPRGL
mmetsp:Transcript_181033/g.574363  ORF Transcript_181033/g.574363 Transcript_181033/m.574363 type:complete len:99 (+) Transcript_181033:3-299(+)